MEQSNEDDETWSVDSEAFEYDREIQWGSVLLN